MISVLVPFYNRKDALWDMFDNYREKYSADDTPDYEILVYDDGSMPEERASLALENAKGLYIRLFEFPPKGYWRTPAVALNYMAREARGEMLVITSPEVRHEGRPLIQVQEFYEKGDLQRKWFCSPCYRLDVQYQQTGPESGNQDIYYFAAITKNEFFRMNGIGENFEKDREDGDFVDRLKADGFETVWLDGVKHLPIPGYAHHKN